MVDSLDSSIAEPSTGLLRAGVRVTFSHERVEIGFGPWQTSLPRAWVDATPSFVELLHRRASIDDVLGVADVAPVVELLRQQGCFVAELPSGDVPLSEVRRLFEPLKLAWYDDYYSHSLWRSLREGAATKNELVAWMIHNYHVSRAAGIVAARLACGHHPWRTFFRTDALEEFWHCDAYYFIDSSNLQVPGALVRRYVPLPGSLAFEQLCSVTADTQPLAHLLIAYFQESSIIFKSGSETFYELVESAYKIPGFLRSWREHIRIDVEHGHAEGLGQLLDDKSLVNAVELRAALKTAWLAFYFLRASLDDVRSQANAHIVLRLPQEAAANGESPLMTAKEVARSQADRLQDSLSTPDGDGVVALVSCVLESGLRALGFSRSHEQMMLAGSLARMRQATPPASATSPWMLAVRNFLLEAAVQPLLWLTSVAFVLRLIERVAPAAIPDKVVRMLDRCEGEMSVRLSAAQQDELTTRLHQLGELIARASERRAEDALPTSWDGQ